MGRRSVTEAKLVSCGTGLAASIVATLPLSRIQPSRPSVVRVSVEAYVLVHLETDGPKTAQLRRGQSPTPSIERRKLGAVAQGPTDEPRREPLGQHAVQHERRCVEGGKEMHRDAAFRKHREDVLVHLRWVLNVLENPATKNEVERQALGELWRTNVGGNGLVSGTGSRKFCTGDVGTHCVVQSAGFDELGVENRLGAPAQIGDAQGLQMTDHRCHFLEPIAVPRERLVLDPGHQSQLL